MVNLTAAPSPSSHTPRARQFTNRFAGWTTHVPSIPSQPFGSDNSARQHAVLVDPPAWHDAHESDALQFARHSPRCPAPPMLIRHA